MVAQGSTKAAPAKGSEDRQSSDKAVDEFPRWELSTAWSPRIGECFDGDGRPPVKETICVFLVSQLSFLSLPDRHS